jgi:rhodanese-related sulfurtransferase
MKAGEPRLVPFDCQTPTVARRLEAYPIVAMEKTISTKDLKSKLDKKKQITLVETLAPERYGEAHIPGALNIPPEQIKQVAPQLLPNKDAEIITYCANSH